jgi:predicted DNA-binding transcriptional regulator YafY
VLQLLSLLQTHKFWPGTELAERLEVSPRTLRRDVDRLRALGYPVDASPGITGGYQLAAGAHLPPLLLDDDEAVAIAVGLRAAAGASVAGIEDTSLRALAKLEQVLPDRLRRRVKAVHSNVVSVRWGSDGSTVDPGALAVLAQACRDREQVRFDYQARDGGESRRLVEPHQLVSTGRRWYLVAWDTRREDWRTFRIDRLRDARLAGVRFKVRKLPATDAAAFVHQSIADMPMPFVATVIAHASPERMREVLRWTDADVRPARHGRARVQLKAESMEQITTTVTAMAVDCAVDVIEPPELAGRLAEVGRRLTR